MVDGWMFDPKDDTLLRVILKVQDIDNNAPHFIKKVFTGGVTTTIEAEFGTEFTQVTVSMAIHKLTYSFKVHFFFFLNNTF